VAADDALIGAMASGARRRLEAIRDALVREMVQRLSRLDQSGGKLASERDSLDNARRIRSQVIELLREEGFPLVVSASEAAVVDAVELALGPAQKMKVAQLTGGIGVTLDAEAKDSIARSVSGVLDEVADAFGDAGDAIREAIDRGVNTGGSLADLQQEVADKLETTFGRAGSAIETAVRGANRLALVQQAERGAEAADVEMLYLYDGPRDGKMREFCARTHGRVYSLDEIKKLDNGTDLDVLVYAGGHSCRHRWSPITRDAAEAEGYEVIS